MRHLNPDPELVKAGDKVGKGPKFVRLSGTEYLVAENGVYVKYTSKEISLWKFRGIQHDAAVERGVFTGFWSTGVVRWIDQVAAHLVIPVRYTKNYLWRVLSSGDHRVLDAHLKHNNMGK